MLWSEISRRKKTFQELHCIRTVSKALKKWSAIDVDDDERIVLKESIGLWYKDGRVHAAGVDALTK